MTRDRVLALLKESGEAYCSGEKMSQALGLSRAAVWKAVDALRQEGYEISSVPTGATDMESSPMTACPPGAGRRSGRLQRSAKT